MTTTLKKNDNNNNKVGESAPTKSSAYINPAKSNTLTLAQLKHLLDDAGVKHDDCKTRPDFVKKLMDYYTSSLPLPPQLKK